MIRHFFPTSDDSFNRHVDPHVIERALHAMNNMAVLTDPRLEDNPIVWCNDYFVAFTGYDRSEVIGRNCRFLQRRSDGTMDTDQAALRRLTRAIRKRIPTHVTLRNYRKDGTPFWNDLYVSPVYDDEGELVYFIGIQNDVTEREEARAEVREREREIEETAENERERFGMDLHDGLGQSLTGIAFLARALQFQLENNDLPHSPEVARLAALVEDAVGEAQQMARGLNPVDASPEGLGDALLALMRSLATTYPDTGFRADVIPVSFDDRREARHLYRIAQEALNNAVRHAGAGEVVVSLEASGSDIVLEIRDDGLGIPGQLLGESTSAVADGHAASDGHRHSVPMESTEAQARLARQGMGLYGMRFRADLIGADLTVTSERGRGTVVRCVLPRGAVRQNQHARGGELE